MNFVKKIAKYISIIFVAFVIMTFFAGMVAGMTNYELEKQQSIESTK